MMTLKKRKFVPQISIVLVYFISNFLILINGGVFWDDWTLFNMSFDGLKQQFYGNGLYFGAYLHYALNQLPYSPFVYHFLVFVFQIFTALLLWDIFKQLNIGNKFYFWIVLLFASSPFFSSKITMICLPYVIGTLLFTLAVWFMNKNIVKYNIIFRISSLVLFFLSFFVSSLLVFYMLPFSILFIKINDIKFDATSIWLSIKSLFKLKNIIRVADYLLLPFVFWIFKNYFFPPSGLYAQDGYNKITIEGFKYSRINTLEGIYESIIKLPSVLYDAVVNYYMFLPALIIFALLYFCSVKYKIKDDKPMLSYFFVLVISLFLIIIAIYPYTLIGKIPVFYSYSDRHQLLLPLGVCMLVVSLVYIFIQEERKSFVLSFILTLFIVTNIYFNLQYIHKWIKNEAIVSYFENNDFDNETIVVEDNTALSDGLNYRDLRFYEFCGMSKLASGKQTNFIADFATFKGLDLEKVSLYGEGYNMANYKPNVPTQIMTIETGNRYSFKQALFLSILKCFSPDSYKNKISDVLKISITEVDEDSEYYNFKYSVDN